MSKKKSAVRRATISIEQYEDIKNEGYEECLRDMVSNIRKVLTVAEEEDLDVTEALEQLIIKVEETLTEDVHTIN